MIEGFSLAAFRQIAVIQAMQGLLASGCFLSEKQIALCAVAQADALVEAMMEPEPIRTEGRSMSQPTEHQKELATVLDRESASTARYDARIDKLEADNLSLRKLLKEYRGSTISHEHCFADFGDERDEYKHYCCTLCRKYDALESK